jgi:hypothetical protein
LGRGWESADLLWDEWLPEIEADLSGHAPADPQAPFDPQHAGRRRMWLKWDVRPFAVGGSSLFPEFARLVRPQVCHSSGKFMAPLADVWVRWSRGREAASRVRAFVERVEHFSRDHGEPH